MIKLLIISSVGLFILRERDHLVDTGVDGSILRLTFRKWGVGVWIGTSWLRTGAGGGHLGMR